MQKEKGWPIHKYILWWQKLSSSMKKWNTVGNKKHWRVWGDDSFSQNLEWLWVSNTTNL
jgi:hypothetical protein